jgi:hypothetical protein
MKLDSGARAHDQSNLSMPQPGSATVRRNWSPVRQFSRISRLCEGLRGFQVQMPASIEHKPFATRFEADLATRASQGIQSAVESFFFGYFLGEASDL